MKNLKNLAILLAFACAIPVCRAEESQTTQATQVEQTEQKLDRTKEYAARTKLSIAEAAMIYGGVVGLVAGVATQSALTGGAIFAVPAAIYAGLRAKYKSMFTKEQFDVVKDTEDEMFIYLMTPITVPALAGFACMFGLPGTVLAAKLGLPTACAAVLGGVSIHTILAALKTNGRKFQEPNNTWGETFNNFKKHFCLEYTDQ